MLGLWGVEQDQIDKRNCLISPVDQIIRFHIELAHDLIYLNPTCTMPPVFWGSLEQCVEYTQQLGVISFGRYHH